MLLTLQWAHSTAYLGVRRHFTSSFLENHINCILLGAVAKRWQLTVLPAVFLGQFRREIKVRVYAFLASNTLTRTHFGHTHKQVAWRGGCRALWSTWNCCSLCIYVNFWVAFRCVCVCVLHCRCVSVCMCVWHAAMTCKTFLGLQSPA